MKTPLFSMTQTAGRMPFRACKFDRRFSYCLYVPERLAGSVGASPRLLVSVHGSERSPETARELFVELAEELNTVVLAPLFPMALTSEEEMHNYLFLEHAGIRFDRVLLAMVDEVAEQFHLQAKRLWLAGFSGGGQFAHRFAYLHASRLEAVSIGAPGIVNSLDQSKDWFLGIRDVQERFGRAVDWNGLRALKAQVVVGAEDTSEEILIEPPNSLYAPGVNDAGPTRVARSRFLHEELVKAGVDCRLDIVPGAMHAAAHVQLAVDSFFRRMALDQPGAAGIRNEESGKV